MYKLKVSVLRSKPQKQIQIHRTTPSGQNPSDRDSGSLYTDHCTVITKPQTHL